jgi:hypothetical protein
MSLEIRNFTPFVPFAFEKEGVARTQYDVVVLKGTFDLLPEQVKIAAIQRLPEMADRYHGEPETSSLAMDGDLVLGKLATDIFVTGSAQALSGVASPQWLAQVQITGGIKPPLTHTLHLTGPRQWEQGMLTGWSLSDPVPVTAVDLKYELAFGGAIERPVKQTPDNPDGIEIDAYPENPVGVGYYDRALMKRTKTYPAPQIMRHGDKLTALDNWLTPAGTAPISRWWPQRYQYAGTYDEAWYRSWQDANGKPIDGVFPALPDDFDYRFYNAAHPSLIYPGFMTGHETIALKGFLADGPLTTRLTGMRFETILHGGDESGRLEHMKLDTLHIDLDARQVMLTWRLTVAKALRAHRVQIMFGAVGEQT